MTRIIAGAAGLALAVAGTVLAVSAQAVAVGCTVNYAVTAQWPGGFTANVSVTNLGTTVDGWTLSWTFPLSGQSVTQMWNATYSTSGDQVSATGTSWNAVIATGASATLGFNGSWSDSNPVPTDFALNGASCMGGSTVSPGASTTLQPSASASASTGVTPTTEPSASTDLVGWAAQNGGTTGGAGGATVTVSNASDLDAALQSSDPLTVQVSGMISLSGMHKVASNKTVIGVGASSGISGGGLNVASAANVIIRNLVFTGADDDAINVQYSTNVWIDHNDLADGYDGLVDIKRASDYITVSWNRFHDHDKTALLGHDDGNAAEDTGHLRVTYHHNWFDATNQRHPRVRFGNPVHVYNNYYGSIGSYGVASTCDAGVLVEGNYFENTDDPFHLAEGDSPDGSLVARDNYFAGSGSGQTGGSVNAIPYGYAMDPASGVKSIVTGGAGTGRI
ncbi:MAG: pectate lyase [Dactylosporangium sp.]|nr:cellulose binding domain-containing protein [Dactylosporangium sp.]NNJ62006.1 pectate lyase [Dactylosporangium sp.]